MSWIVPNRKRIPDVDYDRQSRRCLCGNENFQDVPQLEGEYIIGFQCFSCPHVSFWTLIDGQIDPDQTIGGLPVVWGIPLREVDRYLDIYEEIDLDTDMGDDPAGYMGWAKK